MVNSTVKGKRIERSVAAWLRNLGAKSARRTEQYCGSVDGDPDLTVDEFPSFHIESKGTKSASIIRSKLKAWYNQVVRDSEKTGRIPVIFHEADGKNIIAIFPIETAIKLKLEVSSVEGIIGRTFTPSLYIEEAILVKETMKRLSKSVPEYKFMCTYKIDDERTVLATEGESFVEAMFRYEEEIAKHDINKGSSEAA